MSTKKAPEALQRSEGQKPETNHQEGIQAMTILTPDARPVESRSDTAFTLYLGPLQKAIVRPSTFTDGVPTVELDFGDEGGVRALRLHEARALAAALQAVAMFQDEQPRQLQRPAAYAAVPETDGIGGGL